MMRDAGRCMLSAHLRDLKTNAVDAVAGSREAPKKKIVPCHRLRSDKFPWMRMGPSTFVMTARPASGETMVQLARVSMVAWRGSP